MEMVSHILDCASSIEAFDGALLGQMCSHVAELDDFYSMATREELQ